MSTLTSYLTEPWFRRLSPRVSRLLEESVHLYTHEQEAHGGRAVYGYGFVVFPAAKGYEGFLKEYFLKTGLIGEVEFEDDHFRIGKALNPDLPKRFRDREWLYDDVAAYCGEDMAELLWRAWKLGRNRVFHFRVDEDEDITLDIAKERIELIMEAIAQAVVCQERL